MDCSCEDSQVRKMENHLMKTEENNFHPGAGSHNTLCTTQDVPERHPGARGRMWEVGAYPGPRCHAWRSALSTKSFMRIPGPKQRELGVLQG